MEGGKGTKGTYETRVNSDGEKTVGKLDFLSETV
jgi:hypothetical protein